MLHDPIIFEPNRLKILSIIGPINTNWPLLQSSPKLVTHKSPFPSPQTKQYSKQSIKKQQQKKPHYHLSLSPPFDSAVSTAANHSDVTLSLSLSLSGTYSSLSLSHFNFLQTPNFLFHLFLFFIPNFPIAKLDFRKPRPNCLYNSIFKDKCELFLLRDALISSGTSKIMLHFAF